MIATFYLLGAEYQGTAGHKCISAGKDSPKCCIALFCVKYRITSSVRRTYTQQVGRGYKVSSRNAHVATARLLVSLKACSEVGITDYLSRWTFHAEEEPRA